MLQAASEDFDFDPEDADECDDLDDFMSQAVSAKGNAIQASKGDRAQLQWDVVNFSPPQCTATVFGAHLTGNMMQRDRQIEGQTDELTTSAWRMSAVSTLQ